MKTVQGAKLVSSIERLIMGAERGLVLVSPYFDPWEEVEDGIDEALDRGVDVMIVVRDDQPRSQRAAAEFEERGATIHAVPHLHAKVYLNERAGIMTSMNLLVSSANTAVEMGQILDAVDDAPAYRNLIRESERLAPNLNWGELVMRRSRPRRSIRPRRRSRQVSKGHCVRCSEVIPFDLDQPFCESHFRSWSRFKDPNYLECYCHTCGERAETSMARPRCYSCWQMAERQSRRGAR